MANLYGDKPLDEALSTLSSFGGYYVELGAGGYSGKAHCDPDWHDFISALNLCGYDRAVSMEHEDNLMVVNEGLSQAVALLHNVIINVPSRAQID